MQANKISLWLPALLCACASHGPAGDLRERAIWIDRWDYKTAADVDRIVEDCAKAGFETLFWQVRGNGTVAYRSALEPWSERFGFADPGFDPLQRAVEAAHRRGLKLHAWVNVLVGWSGPKDPTDARQLWLSRRDWFVQDQDGRPLPLTADGYRALDPCLPAVRAHVAALCAEICRQYPVDGIHLDRIRFPDAAGDPGQLGRNPRATALFTAQTGRLSSDLGGMHDWQRAQVTATVQGIRDAVRGSGRPVPISAAVFADLQVARDKVRQDWPDWARRGLVDMIVPMNYTADEREFGRRTAAHVQAARGVAVVPGVGGYKLGSGAQAIAQMEAALHNGASGVAVFNYRTLFGEVGKPATPAMAEVREAVQTWFGREGVAKAR